MTRILMATAASMIAALTPPASSGADYPVKPVRIVVGAATGGGVDVTARMLAIKLSDLFKQQFVVENRAGASGNIGTEQAARAA
ncbi:MAG TPA: tripartite tricarboxylate transporter substrate-binding protein, partial [Burkholderiales bacterium]|nr:tripartite tricarboxylate transporter substrate-binding protein [Burkholderiales bacterium]